MTKVRIRWAPRVSRAKVRRLYESDAAGMLDTDLLDEVGYGIYGRCQEMFEVRQAINGKVRCRRCRKHEMPRTGWGQVDGQWQSHKDEILSCPECAWTLTWGDYYDSYTGNRMLPGSATEAFTNFVAAWPTAKTPAQKLQLIDILIHEFHVNQGIDGRPVGENVISGSRQQVIDLLNDLAYGDTSLASPDRQAAWQARLNAPVRRFRQANAWQKVHAMARELNIQAPNDTDDQKSVVEEILRRRREA